MDSDSCSSTLNVAQKTYHVDHDRIDSIVGSILAALQISNYETSVTFVDPDQMRELNSQYRGKDRSTDVLSFPQEDWQKPLLATPAMPPETASHPQQDHSIDDDRPPQILGDLVISLDDAHRNALSIGHSLDREVAFLLVHGILHLCGHDHLEEEEEKLMKQQQKLLMNHLQAADDPLWLECARID